MTKRRLAVREFEGYLKNLWSHIITGPGPYAEAEEALMRRLGFKSDLQERENCSTCTGGRGGCSCYEHE